ncbi:DUF892 family protein [Halocatena pleomorpha]|uniref:DUF892 family protein n=1 Tax=Halocatena pleomorpha TaxID=1785090 RepID=A0A3P3RDS8_9EURY|nr:DUF892 family protein [Halocatena pleomorpha]RRJ31545.1 DUF892 family protein [Halocatena pleomorpha]
MTDDTFDTFTTGLQRLYYLEQELVATLDVLATDVSIDTLDDLTETDCRKQLQDRVETHRDETRTHVERLETVFEAVDEQPIARHAPGLDGWIADKERFNNIILNDKLRPLYFLDATLKLEEIERSAYEPMVTLAKQLENEGEIEGVVENIAQNAKEEQEMLDDLESLAGRESVETLLETSPVDPANRSSLARSGGNIETLEDMFVYQLRNLSYIERTLAVLFEELAMTVTNDELSATFTEQHDQAQSHVDRLGKVFDGIGLQSAEMQNRTLDGLLKSRETQSAARNGGRTDLFDLEIAVAAKRMENRCYEELLTLAERIEYPVDAVDQLTTNSHEVHEATSTLERQGFEDLRPQTTGS